MSNGDGGVIAVYGVGFNVLDGVCGTPRRDAVYRPAFQYLEGTGPGPILIRHHRQAVLSYGYGGSKTGTTTVRFNVLYSIGCRTRWNAVHGSAFKDFKGAVAGCILKRNYRQTILPDCDGGVSAVIYIGFDCADG